MATIRVAADTRSGSPSGLLKYLTIWSPKFSELSTKKKTGSTESVRGDRGDALRDDPALLKAGCGEAASITYGGEPGASVVTLFEELRSTAIRQSEESDFPLWLLADVLQIADNPEFYARHCGMLELLLAQIHDFDSFAGVGCFDSSTSADTIRRTVDLIKTIAKADPVPPHRPPHSTSP